MIATLLFHLYDVIVRLLSAKMVLAKGIIYTLCNIIEAPVHAVQEEVNINGINTNIAYLSLHTTGPHITSILCHLAMTLHPMLPRVAIVTSQHHLVTLLRAIFAKQWVIQRCRSVCLFKLQAERMLRILLCQASVPTMQFQAAVDGEVMLLRTTKEFCATLARPSVSCIVTDRRAGKDVYTTLLFVILMAEEVILICYHAQNRQLFQALYNLRTQSGISRHIRVHLIVGNGNPFCRSIFSPCIRIPHRIIRLAQHR